MLEEVAAGRFLPQDGLIDVLPAPPGRCDAVMAFTAHHIVAAPVEAADVLERLPQDDLSAPMAPRFLQWLASQLGTGPGSLDVVLATGGTGRSGSGLVERPDLTDHPRVVRAARYRTGLRVLTDPEDRGVVIVGDGLAGRREVSVEVDPVYRGTGVGRALIARAVAATPAGAVLFAQVSPGNTASLRSFLAAGFKPIGAEVLFLRR